MKSKYSISFAASGLAFILAGSLAAVQAAPAGAPSSGAPEKNSFSEVTSRLDTGGPVYLYLSTERWLHDLSDQVSSLRDVLANRSATDADRANISRGVDLLSRLIKRSGIEDVSGVGVSSVGRPGGMFRNKIFLHRYADAKAAGLLWTAGGKAPHSLEGLKLLPANTVLANVSDWDIASVWAVVHDEVDAAGAPEWRSGLQQVPQLFEAWTGLHFDQVLASLGGQVGMVVTLDETRKISIPMGAAGAGGQTQALEIQEPNLALVVRVNNDLIFDRIDQVFKASPQVVQDDEPGLDLRARTMPAPNPFLPNLRPTVARFGPYLILATSDALVKEMAAVYKGSKPGLTATSEEYKRLSVDVPAEGNQFNFVARAFGDAIAEVQRAQLRSQAAAGGDPSAAALMQKFIGGSEGMAGYNVGAQMPDGWFVVGNSTRDASRLLAPLMMLPAAMIAGAAMPGLLHPPQPAPMKHAALRSPEENQIRANLHTIIVAKRKWVVEHNLPLGAPLTEEDIAPALGAAKITPIVGETYQVNPVGKPPTATLPKDKSLPGLSEGAVIGLNRAP